MIADRKSKVTASVREEALKSTAAKISESAKVWSCSDLMKEFHTNYEACSVSTENRRLVMQEVFGDYKEITKKVAEQLATYVNDAYDPEDRVTYAGVVNFLHCILDCSKGAGEVSTLLAGFEAFGKLHPYMELVNKSIEQSQVVDDETMAQVGKVIADLKRATDRELSPSTAKWIQDCINDMKEKGNQWQNRCQELYEKAASAAEVVLEKVREEIKPLLDLASSWRALITNDLAWSQVYILAKDSKLALATADEVRSAIRKVKGAVKDAEVAKKTAGHVVTDETFKQAEVEWKKLLVLEVECELVDTLGEPGKEAMRPSDTRPKVVTSVRKLRDNGLVDKDHLTRGMYTSTYIVLLRSKSSESMEGKSK